MCGNEISLVSDVLKLRVNASVAFAYRVGGTSVICTHPQQKNFHPPPKEGSNIEKKGKLEERTLLLTTKLT